MTYEMHPKHFSSVASLPPRERYDYFIKKVADWGELWGLFDNGWATLADNEEKECMPVWPHEEFARHYATGDWQRFVPRRIELQEWISKWTQRLTDDLRKVAIFPVPAGKCTTAAPDRLRHDLEEELDKFE